MRSRLALFAEDDPAHCLQLYQDPLQIKALLNPFGIGFEQWPFTTEPEIRNLSPAQILAQYQQVVTYLMQQEGYQAVDVVSLTPNHPDKAALRAKFLQEHTHNEDEVRFFVAGCGLFSIHVAAQVYELTCYAGDLIRLPAHTRHWFDMGEQPDFIAIRWFNNPAGWVAHYTGSTIAAGFSRLEV